MLQLQYPWIIDSYTPLQRPEALTAVVKSEPSDEQIVSSDNDNDNDSNDDDDDDDDDDSDQASDLQCFRPKKLKKVKREKLCKPITAAKSNKYNVWSIGLQEEALTETLEKCDVETVDRSRDVESYYKFKYYDDHDTTAAGISDQLSEVSVKKEIKMEPHAFNNKRRHDERRNGKQRIKRHLSPNSRWSKPRVLPELEVTVEDTVEIVAADIAAKLREQKDHLIMKTAEVIGKEKTIKLYNKTKSIEAGGGMLVMNGSRRRTSGGVFLTLLKKDEDVTHDMLREIFGEERSIVTKARRQTLALKRKQKTNELRKSLIEDGLLNNDFPEILEQKVRELPGDRKIKIEPDEGDGDHAVSNPPPSPATDQDTPPPNIRQITSYDDGDDDFLELGGAEDMELF